LLNARELLDAAEHWLGWNSENLSAGLRCAFDALRLYDYAQAHPELPEMADDWEPAHRIQAVGYDPMVEPDHESTISGASAVAEVLGDARALLDSVAFVATEGDTTALIARVDDLLGQGGLPFEPCGSKCAESDSKSFQ